jgi:hypothetical protein
MTPTFITLPSGKRVNAADIIQYCPHYKDEERLWMEIRSSVEGENEGLEEMTPEHMDRLLRPPAVASTILDLRLPKVGDPVMFHLNGQDKHGIVESVVRGDNQSYTIVDVSSGGEMFRYWPDSGDTIKI